jgi:hypothetical protein
MGRAPFSMSRSFRAMDSVAVTTDNKESLGEFCTGHVSPDRGDLQIAPDGVGDGAQPRDQAIEHVGDERLVAIAFRDIGRVVNF